MNLETELEPLLAQLPAHFDDYVARLDRRNHEDFLSDVNLSWQRLLHLEARFRSYYTLDEFDFDRLPDRFFDAEKEAPPLSRGGVPPPDWYYARSHDSVHGHIVDADYYVRQDLEKLVGLNWHGKAATEFRLGFMGRFRTAAYIHTMCAGELALGAVALAAQVGLAKRSVVWICKALLSYIGAIPGPGKPPVEGEPTEGGADEYPGETVDWWKKGAEIVKKLTELGEKFYNLKDLPASLLFRGIEFGADTIMGFRESHEPGRKSPWQVTWSVTGERLGADSFSPFACLDAAGEALGELDRHMDEADGRIGQFLQQAVGPDGPAAGGRGTRGASRPDIGSADSLARDGLDLTPVKASDYDYEVFNKDVVAADVERLYYAGAVTMPQAAEQYDAGVRICTLAVFRGVDNHFPRSVTNFNDAADRLGNRMTQVRDELTTSGEALVAAAQAYHEVDDLAKTAINRAAEEGFR